MGFAYFLYKRMGGILMLFPLLCLTSGEHSNGRSCPSKDVSFANLDAAIDSIRKVKEDFPPCQDSCLKPLDCEDILKLGYNVSKVYTIWPKSRVSGCKSVDVYCDMDTDGGGWTVIQRRGNFMRPNDYFFKDWQSYKAGFGDIKKDFWLGNDNIYALSNQKLCSVRVDLKDVDGNKRFALYDEFWIDDESYKYKLHISDYSGDAGDSLIIIHNNQKFSTKDQKNDNEGGNGCALTYKGGWWYNKCHASNLNGLYLRGKHKSYADGVIWHSWKGHYESMDTTEIKIRSKSFRKSDNDALTPQ